MLRRCSQVRADKRNSNDTWEASTELRKRMFTPAAGGEKSRGKKKKKKKQPAPTKDKWDKLSYLESRAAAPCWRAGSRGSRHLAPAPGSRAAAARRPRPRPYRRPRYRWPRPGGSRVAQNPHALEATANRRPARSTTTG
jgi:hypothetical protein